MGRYGDCNSVDIKPQYPDKTVRNFNVKLQKAAYTLHWPSGNICPASRLSGLSSARRQHRSGGPSANLALIKQLSSERAVVLPWSIFERPVLTPPLAGAPRVQILVGGLRKLDHQIA